MRAEAANGDAVAACGSSRTAVRSSARKSRWLARCMLSSGCLFQSGCSTFFIRELEALFAPSSPGNALFVLDSLLFDLLAPLIY